MLMFYKLILCCEGRAQQEQDFSGISHRQKNGPECLPRDVLREVLPQLIQGKPVEVGS